MLKIVFPFFFFCLSLAAQAQLAKDPQLFWEIKSPQGVKSYIFGTLHSNDKRVFDLPDSVYTVLKNTDVLVVESDIYSIMRDLEVRSSVFDLRFDINGLPYSSNNTAGETAYGNEDGMPHFLDMYLLNLAQMNGKEYLALESMETQLKLAKNKAVAADSVYLDEVLLASTLEGLYINGDVAGIDKVLRKYYSEGLYQKMIIDRNIAMAQRLDTLLLKSNALILLGAAHLGGNYSVLKFLKEKGWQIRLASATSTEKAVDKWELRRAKTFIYENETYFFHSEWSGVPVEMTREGSLNYYFFKELGQGNVYSVELIDKEGYEGIEEITNDFILSPGDAKTLRYLTDDGYVYYEGISDSYPEGYAWVRIIEGPNSYAVLKAFGGNKFMNSNRPKKFFNGCWFMN